MEWQDLTLRVPHRKNNEKGGEAIYIEIMAVNFSELMKKRKSIGLKSKEEKNTKNIIQEKNHRNKRVWKQYKKANVTLQNSPTWSTPIYVFIKLLDFKN